MLRRTLLAALLLPALSCSTFATAQRTGPLVLAASSLQEAFEASADAWAKAGHPRPMLAFAASSALARQVRSGAPAALFASADEEWMDVLAREGRLVPGTRANLAGNRLVVVARRGTPGRLTLRTLCAVLARGPLAMADPAAVPAGKYGRAALERLGAWAAVAPHIVRAENVRAALALVERGAAPYGIVYLTDARASAAVRVAGVFPAASHPPIRYPIARLKPLPSGVAGGERAEAEGFRRFLLSAPGQVILQRFGFTRP